MNTYKLNIDIYSLADCGANLDKCVPVTIFYTGFDLDVMKTAMNTFILNAMHSLDVSDGETFLDINITKNGQHYDHEELTAFVDLNENTITYEI